MATGIQYNPIGAVGYAARDLGLAQYVQEHEREAERRRLADMEVALQVERVRMQRDRDQFERGMSGAQLAERQRQFDAGLHADAARQQASLAAQYDTRAASDANALARGQLSNAANRDRLTAGLIEQQMELQGDAARQAAMAERQMQQTALTGDFQLRNKLAASGEPEWVQEGLRSGAYRYTDKQKQEMLELQESLQKARQDMRLSPDERMRFEAQQLGRYNQIRDNPVEVPFDERPVSAADQFEQESPLVTDPATGQQYRVTRTRSGDWRVVEPPKDDSQNLAFKQQEFDLKTRQAKQQEEQRNREFDMKLREQQNHFEIKALDGEFALEMKTLEEEMPSPEDVKKSGPADANGEPTEVNDLDAYNKAFAAWKAKKDAVIKRFNDRRATLPLGPADQRSPMPAQIPATPEQMPQSPEQLPAAESSGPPQWYLDLPSGATYTAPDGTTRVKP